MPARRPGLLEIGASVLGQALKNVRSTGDLVDVIFTAGSRTGGTVSAVNILLG